ncbi:NfeD family protein [Sphingomonas oligophenolica]|uniref:NfeD family protein n=1 Tax=Sphingomonas oligophenolica TaxID=301154 RepID=A0ABU9YC75_9SPHN
MTLLGLAWSWGPLWLAAALVLAIAEIIAPGFFMIFLAAGAALTGIAVLIVPGMPLILQALLFALFTAAAVGLGRRWYSRGPATADPLLNDRAARLIGTTVEVCEPIVAGEGRVKVGDGAWTARGPDAASGAIMRVTGAAGNVLLVEAV